jgi:hypothetical protein
MAEPRTRLGRILQQEYQSKGIVGGTFSALGKRSLEKLDIRNALFGGSGLGSVIGQKIFGKGYSATRKTGASGVQSVSELSQNLNSAVLEEINANSRVSAKNSVVLPSMARDMNLMRMNIIKLVKLQGGTPSMKADMFFSRAKEREDAFERQLGRKTPTAVSQKEKSSEKSFSFLDLMKTAFFGLTTLIKGAWEAVKFIMDKITGLMSSIAGLIMELRLLRGLQTLGGGLPNVDGAGADRKGNEKGKPGASPKGVGRMGLLRSAVGIGGLLYSSDLNSGEKEYLEENRKNQVFQQYGLKDTSPVKMNKFSNEGESISQAAAVRYFTERGLTPEQSAGVVGNLMQESSLKSNAWNESEKAYGIAQWRNERLEGLKAFAAANGKEISDIHTQMDYILHELQTTESKAGQKLMKSSSAAEAAFNFGKYYERPAVVENTRIAYAEQALQSYGKGNPTQETPTKLAGNMINQSSFNNEMAKSLDKGESVVLNTNNINNNSGGGSSGQLSSADVMDTELGRLLLTRMY